jgi:hypothetical protein
MGKRSVVALLACGSVNWLSTAKGAVTLGQSDTFQDGTTDNWAGGDTLSIIPTGGPAGSGDEYLQLISSGGGGTGSKLATSNSSQWIGNYQLAGVTAVSAEFLNPNSVPLLMRFVLIGPTGGRYTSSVAATIPADDAWHAELFSLQSSALTEVSGSDTYAATIADVTEVLIRYDSTPTSGGTTFAGTVGIDDITATTVPEPVGAALLATPGLALCVRRRKRSGPV